MHARINKRLVFGISLFLIALYVFVMYPMYKFATCGIRVLERSDGEFVHFKLNKDSLASFFKQTGLKPIDLSTLVIREYRLRIEVLKDQTIYLKTITIPVGYVSDGVSKPFHHVLPIPHNREGHYWVYHDWLYQMQAYDDGTPASKQDADDIMNLLIMGEVETLLHPWKTMYRLCVEFYKHNDANYRKDLKTRGVAMYDPLTKSITFSGSRDVFFAV